MTPPTGSSELNPTAVTEGVVRGEGRTLPYTLDTDVSVLPRVGKRYVARFDKLGIHTVRDLLLHIPRRYDDTREIIPLERATIGATVTAKVTVAATRKRASPHRKMTLVEAYVEDSSAGIRAVWFNQPYIEAQLPAGREILISGKVVADRRGLYLRAPTFEGVGDTQHHVGTLAPVYPETDGLTSRMLRARIEEVLPLCGDLFDPLPAQVIRKEGLVSLPEAIRFAHNPTTTDEISKSRERMTFQKLFFLQLATERVHRRATHARGVVVPYNVEAAREYVGHLPFTLTSGQRKAAHTILTEMAESVPMNRLLQGDVGSGKTAVAAMAAYVAARADVQTAVMAPTEVLARQHLATLTNLLGPLGIYPRLLVGSTNARARREILQGFAQGSEMLLVGTHAIIEEEVALPHLGLVVIDEQHRFGVEQRQQLRHKVVDPPNFLSMTATPIPRTLALALWGDMNVTEITEMPGGRVPIVTRVIPPSQREEAYAYVRSRIDEGGQAFVICPLVEGSPNLEAASATEEFERLSTTVFSDLTLEILHGRMPSHEKEERMGRFSRGEAQLLVATSVVEVGVDVPNASVVLIEGAERFGIAQLHQLRGRVGRGARGGHCLLVSTTDEPTAMSRLQAVEMHASGFELADIDLRLRGSGEMLGLRQHGATELELDDLMDVAMMRRARAAASSWLDVDPTLAHPGVHEAMEPYAAFMDLD